MARTVQDTALLLSAMAGPDARSPIAIAEPAGKFGLPLDRDFKGVRIAWSRDLGGLPVDRRVTQAMDAQRRVLEDLGALVEEATPDLRDADETFKVWRAWSFALSYGDLLSTHRRFIKDTIIWNVEEGLKLTGSQIAQAERQRTDLYHRVRVFMQRYEFLICPVSQVPPFDVKTRFITAINDEEMGTYIDWMKSCYFITVTGHPAISVPCGFTAEGLPVGIQMVGRHQDDWGVLQLANAFEQATGIWKQRPAVAA